MSRNLGPGRQREIPLLLPPRDHLVLGPVQVIPPWTGPVLRRNMAATGKHGQARSAKSKCPRFQGNPDQLKLSGIVFLRHGWGFHAVWSGAGGAREAEALDGSPARSGGQVQGGADDAV